MKSWHFDCKVLLIIIMTNSNRDDDDSPSQHQMAEQDEKIVVVLLNIKVNKHLLLPVTIIVVVDFVARA